MKPDISTQDTSSSVSVAPPAEPSTEATPAQEPTANGAAKQDDASAVDQTPADSPATEDATEAAASAGSSEVVAEAASEGASDAGEEAASPASELTADELVVAKQKLEGEVVDAISTVFDPEIPVNIYELGLIYEIQIDDNFGAVVQMTLTSPACPVAGSLPLEVEEKALTVDGVTSARVELVWDPPWTPDLMSEAAKLELGFFY